MVLKYKDLTLREIVERVLKNNEIARNNDNWLWFLVMEYMGYNIILDKNLLESMPTGEDVSRIRRTIQNDENRLEANEEVRKRRLKHSTEQKDYFGRNKNGGLSAETMVNSQYS